MVRVFISVLPTLQAASPGRARTRPLRACTVQAGAALLFDQGLLVSPLVDRPVSAKTFGFVAIASLLSCGRPATFPRGGPVRATGICHASVDPAPPPTTTIPSVRAPWLGQAGSAAKADGYGYALGDASDNVVLRFEAGRLTSLAVEEPTRETFDAHAPRQGSAPRWRGEGSRDEVFVEGRPYDVRVDAVAPPGDRGTEHVRVTFEGERVLVLWRGRAAVARCAWDVPHSH